MYETFPCQLRCSLLCQFKYWGKKSNYPSSVISAKFLLDSSGQNNVIIFVLYFRNFCDKFRRSQEKQKQSVPFLEHVKTSPDASVSRAAENGLWDKNGKNTKSETSPITNTVVPMPQISSVPSLPSSFSNEDLNRDQN